jgi:hypothetical protein
MRQALRAAAASPVHYERRRPEETTLYRVVQGHLETFLAQVEAEGVASLPQFVKDEFDAFLECGILAHGFLRVRCTECGHEKLVAFSCKRRGICPACGARRMAETAAWLVDRVIPKMPVRQWVLSFPIPLRSLFAVHPELLAPVLQIIHRVIARHLIKQAGLKRSEAGTDAVTLIHRVGSASRFGTWLCFAWTGRSSKYLNVSNEESRLAASGRERHPRSFGSRRSNLKRGLPLLQIASGRLGRGADVRSSSPKRRLLPFPRPVIGVFSPTFGLTFPFWMFGRVPEMPRHAPGRPSYSPMKER